MTNRTLTFIEAIGSLLSLAAPGWSQTVCPGVPFLTAPVITARSGENISILKRETNGSFTAMQYRNPSYEVAGQSANFQRKVTACFPTRISSAGPPATPPPVLGNPAQFAAAGDFFGSGSLGWVRMQFDKRETVDVVQVTGTLTVTGSVPIAAYRRILAVDLNGDGLTDLVVASTTDSNHFYVLLSGGGGPSPFHRTADLTAGVSPTSITAGDLNGDGKIDLIATDSGSGTGDLYVFFGDGKGGFKAGGKVSIGSPAASVAIGDWNGDGKADLAIAGHEPYQFIPLVDRPNYITILLGNGDGTFGAPKHFLAGSQQTYITSADLNRDGKLDLVATNLENNAVMVFLGIGDGTFAPAVGYAVGDEPDSVVITDFDGDGILDIVVGAGEPRLILPNGPSVSVLSDAVSFTILLGRGDGTFWGAAVYPVEQYTIKTSIGDVNGDGFPDLIAASPIENNSAHASGVYISLGHGNGVFDPFLPARTPPVPIFFSAIRAFAGDFNGDGIADLITVGGSGTSVFTGQADGSYQMLIKTSGGGEPMSVLDLDRDGKLDLLVPGYSTSTGNHPQVWWGSGAGTFDKIDLPPSMFPQWAAAADLNGDSLLDIVVADAFGILYSWLARGDRTFAPPAAIAAGLNPIGAALADVNGDGKVDVVAICNFEWNIGFRATFPALLVFLGNGDGTFQPPIATPDLVFDAPQLRPIAAVAMDFDRDGFVDIMFASQCIGGPPCIVTGGNYLGFLKGNGDGTFRKAVLIPAGPGILSLAVADVNGDHWPDLVLGGQRGATTVFLNQPPVPRPLVNVSAASFLESVQAPSAIVSAFGDHLATTTATAHSLTLPTTLGGTSVALADSFGNQRQAELYYVSPTQVNYVMPTGLLNGPATVTVHAADGAVRQSEIIVQPTATSVFSINAGGLAAAEVHRVRNGVAQPPEQVYRIESGAVVPAPIDLGPPSDQVFLHVYATGIRNANGLYALLGDTPIPTVSLGPQGTLSGLDQVTIGPIPRSLAGKGRAALALYFYRMTSTTFVMIK